MKTEEVKFQVALSCIQGVLEAKHGVIGEIVPEIAVAESLRIADEFVKQWFKEESTNTDNIKWIKCERGTDIETSANFYILMDLEGKVWFSKGPTKDDCYVITVEQIKRLGKIE